MPANKLQMKKQVCDSVKIVTCKRKAKAHLKFLSIFNIISILFQRNH